MTDIPRAQLYAVVNKIAAVLGEKDQYPRRQILRIVRVCGPEEALVWLTEAQAIEAEGGMMTRDGTRRRTLGGVYFAHVRDELFKAQRRQELWKIFIPQDREAKRKALQEARAAQAAKAPPGPKSPAEAKEPPEPRASWAERGEWVPEAREAAGKATAVKVTIIGRPGRVVERQGFVLFQMNDEGKLPALPKGLPAPAAPPPTSYTVYVSAKQWRGVAEAIAVPEDALVIEGVQWYDPEYESIVVMATKTTTKLLQRAGRPQAPSPAPPPPEA